MKVLLGIFAAFIAMSLGRRVLEQIELPKTCSAGPRTKRLVRYAQISAW